jgi:hypothetical protein
MTKRVGSTVFGVNIGCQALRRCCLNAVSLGGVSRQTRNEIYVGSDLLAGRRHPPFPLPGLEASCSPLGEVSCCCARRLKIAMMVVVRKGLCCTAFGRPVNYVIALVTVICQL